MSRSREWSVFQQVHMFHGYTLIFTCYVDLLQTPCRLQCSLRLIGYLLTEATPVVHIHYVDPFFFANCAARAHHSSSISSVTNARPAVTRPFDWLPIDRSCTCDLLFTVLKFKAIWEVKARSRRYETCVKKVGTYWIEAAIVLLAWTASGERIYSTHNCYCFFIGYIFFAHEFKTLLGPIATG